MRTRSVRLGGVLASMALVLASCGDEDGDTGGPEGPADGEQGDAGESTAAGDPIRIGLVNLESSIVSFPEARAGAEAAADHVNRNGGVAGRPIEYVTCEVDVSPETMVDCANQFVEAGVVLVQEAIAPGGGAALPILTAAGIPIVGHLPLDPQLESSEHATYFGVAGPTSAAASMELIADQGHDSVSFFLADLPESRDYVDEVVQPAADELGITFRPIYTPLQPDWNVQVAAAMADDPDVIGYPSAGEDLCVGYIGALRSAGYDGLVLGAACSQFVEVLGEQAAGVVTVSDTWRPDDRESAPSDKQDDIDLYLEAMEAAGHDDITSTIAFAFFADTMNLAAILETIDGEIDGESVAAALGSTVEMDSFMGPPLTCDGSVWPGQRTCRNAVLFYEVTADGTQRAMTDDFIIAEPPRS